VHFVSRISSAPRLEAAVAEVCDSVLEALGGSDPDLAIVFVSPQHREGWVQLPRLLGERLGAAVLLGCSGGGVIGGGREIEQAAALSLTAAHLPGVELTPFHLPTESVPPPGTPTRDWNARLGLPDGPTPHFVVLPDPLTSRAPDFVSALDSAYPESVVIGGLASGGDARGQHALFVGQDVHGSGIAGLSLAGNLEIDTVVAQGCRPVGTPLFVTRGEGNVIHELDGRRPSDALQELYNQLSERDRQLMRHSLSLGVAMTEGREVYRQGDFLVRNIVGLDGRTGAMAVGATVHAGLVVQFQLRDAKTSAADLDTMLARYASTGAKPAGALLFSCLGRGQSLYGQPDHDSGVFRRHLGAVPLGGFFCNGEIGPVGGHAYVHGYTSAFAMFRRTQTN
jgi:small ligand-binding sensory domain FIST